MSLSDWYWQFQKLLVENHAEERQVSWYADQLHISTAYLYKICIANAGFSPQTLISDMVFKESKRLLLVTDDPIKEIAYTLKFSTESSFCKFFHKHMGISPSSFRQFELNKK